jgi:hypothetical protein
MGLIQSAEGLNRRLTLPSIRGNASCVSAMSWDVHFFGRGLKQLIPDPKPAGLRPELKTFLLGVRPSGLD